MLLKGSSVGTFMYSRRSINNSSTEKNAKKDDDDEDEDEDEEEDEDDEDDDDW